MGIQKNKSSLNGGSDDSIVLNISTSKTESLAEVVPSTDSGRVSFCIRFAIIAIVLVQLTRHFQAGSVDKSGAEIDQVSLKSSWIAIEYVKPPSKPPTLHVTSVDSGCQCRAGATALGSDGKCHAWCSKYGYCGASHQHISGGKDCRDSASVLQSNSSVGNHLSATSGNSTLTNETGIQETSMWGALSSLSKSHRGVALALFIWDGLATQYGIPYRLEYGSLLGYVRSQSIISHDTDADVLIDASSLNILELLTGNPEQTYFLDAQSHPPLSRSSLLAAAKRAGLKWREEMAVRVLFRARSHMLDFSSVTRTNCKGVSVRSMTDACSFSGPVARILHFGKSKTSYVELYLAGCKYRKPVGSYRTWHCRKATNDCSFCPSTEAQANIFLQKSGGEIARCTFSGVKTWCPASEEWSQKHLYNVYGPGWVKSNPKHVYSDTAASGG